MLALASGGQAATSCRVSAIVTLPVTMSGLRPLVRAQINGKDATFIADSGAWFSMISPGSAAEYGLSLEHLPPGFRMTGVGGSITPMLTTVKTFTFAGVPVPRVQFLVGGSEVGSVGLLGQNVLALADAEFDLARGAIRLMRSDGCSSKANLAYWLAPGEAYSMLDTERMSSERPHIVASISVNGVKLRALFDTGASTSFVSLKAAARIGLKPGNPDVKPAGASSGLGRAMVPTWIGPVASIKIGDEEIRNTRLRFGGDFTDADMLVGADFFLSHRVYWSDKLHKLFFTFNGGHVFDLRYLRDRDGDDAREPAKVPPPAAADELPTDAAGFSRRGGARAARGDFAGGLADLDQAVKLAPDNVDYLWQRAQLHLQMRQPLQAVDDAARVLKLKPDHVDALLMRAGVRRSLDRDADVRSDIDAAAAAASKSSDRRLAIAGSYSGLGEYQRAAEQYSLWLAAHPDDNKKVVALNGRCWANAMAGKDFDRALKDCNAALAIRPHTASFLDSRGMVRVRMGDYARAIVDYDEALAASPNAAWSHYGRGIARIRLGQKQEGEADLARAKALDATLPAEAAKLGLVP